MAEILTDRLINLGQLSYELGRVPLRSVGPYPEGEENGGKLKIKGDIDQGDLESAVAAHVADLEWIDPDNPPVPAASDAEKIAELIDAVSVLTDLVFAQMEG